MTKYYIVSAKVNDGGNLVMTVMEYHDTHVAAVMRLQTIREMNPGLEFKLMLELG